MTWDQFNRLPIRAGEVWQGATTLLPQRIARKQRGQVDRARGAIWVHDSGHPMLAWDLTVDHAARQEEALLAQLVATMKSREGGYRPGRIEVREVELARLIREKVNQVEVVVRDELPGMERFLRAMADHFEKHSPADPMTLPGMTTQIMVDFAEAAKAFFEAKPWRILSSDDLIRVVSPGAAMEIATCCAVLGNGGRSYGLAFFESVEAFSRMVDARSFDPMVTRKDAMSVCFSDIGVVPFWEARLFDALQLPTAERDAFPYIMYVVGGTSLKQPSTEMYVFATKLLLAIATMTEAQVDAGKWGVDVRTSDGVARVELEMPILIEQMSGKAKRAAGAMDRRSMDRTMRDIGELMKSKEFKSIEEMNKFLAKQSKKGVPRAKPKDDRQRAQALADDAFEVRGRRQIQLARQAIGLDPDCCDALTILAEHGVDGDEVGAWRRVVDAGKRSLGEAVFEESVGHFWGVVETRPYMRARQHLAEALVRAERIDEAASHYLDMLRLNPGDNQGHRYSVAPLLAELKRWEELSQVANNPEYDDGMAMTLWAKAAAQFGLYGATRKSETALAEAIRANRGVAELLLSKEPCDGDVSGYSPASPEEAEVCAHLWVRLVDRDQDFRDWIDGVVWKMKHGKLSGPSKQNEKRRKQ
jgi:tetratricopeptide (TPR) repeat protein